MTKHEQIAILEYLAGVDLDNVLCYNANNEEIQVLKIESEDNGDLYVNIRDIKKKKKYITSLVTYIRNEEGEYITSKNGYVKTNCNDVLIKNIIKSLGRKRIKEIKESIDDMY